jgi:hypothetical protein
MPRRPGVSSRSFSKLETELIVVAKRLSNRQLLELADDFHALLRERRSLHISCAPAAQMDRGVNDNNQIAARR